MKNVIIGAIAALMIAGCGESINNTELRSADWIAAQNGEQVKCPHMDEYNYSFYGHVYIDGRDTVYFDEDYTGEWAGVPFSYTENNAGTLLYDGVTYIAIKVCNIEQNGDIVIIGMAISDDGEEVYFAKDWRLVK